MAKNKRISVEKPTYCSERTRQHSDIVHCKMTSVNVVTLAVLTLRELLSHRAADKRQTNSMIPYTMNRLNFVHDNSERYQ